MEMHRCTSLLDVNRDLLMLWAKTPISMRWWSRWNTTSRAPKYTNRYGRGSGLGQGTESPDNGMSFTTRCRIAAL